MGYVAVPPLPPLNPNGYVAAGRTQPSGGYIPVPPTGFLPSQVTSATLKLWLDARLGVTIATGVSSWADQSGNGNTFTQGTGGSQPAFNATAINGFPGVVGAAGKSLALASAVIAQSGARTLYYVVATGISAGSAFYMPRGGQGYSPIADAQGGPSFVESNQTTTNSTIAGAIVTGNYYMRMSFDGVSTNLPLMTINGVTQTLSNGAGAGVGAESATATETLFNAANGTLGTLLVYSGVVSAGEDAQVQAYLKARYGL